MAKFTTLVHIRMKVLKVKGCHLMLGSIEEAQHILEDWHEYWDSKFREEAEETVQLLTELLMEEVVASTMSQTS